MHSARLTHSPSTHDVSLGIGCPLPDTVGYLGGLGKTQSACPADMYGFFGKFKPCVLSEYHGRLLARNENLPDIQHDCGQPPPPCSETSACATQVTASSPTRGPLGITEYGPEPHFPQPQPTNKKPLSTHNIPVHHSRTYKPCAVSQIGNCSSLLCESK